MDMAGYRRAAVALHALGDTDRHWILGELPPEQRRLLHACLAEFTALGFAADVAAAAVAPADASGFLAAPARTPVSPSLNRLAMADAADMATLLRDEPPALIALLMTAQEWPWASGFLAALPPAQRDRVLSAIDARRAAPACQAFLLDLAAKRLPDKPAALPPSGAGWTMTRAGAATKGLLEALVRACPMLSRKGEPWNR